MQENQGFSSTDTISVFSLILIVVGIISYVTISSVSGSKLDDAHRYAVAIANQLAKGNVAFNSVLSGNKNRKIASDALRIAETGQIGLDPWGRPLTYSLVANESGGRILFVISAGPNQKRETTDEVIKKSILKSNDRLPLTDSDDIIVTRPM